MSRSRGRGDWAGIDRRVLVRANQPGLKWLEAPDHVSVTPEADAAIRSDRYRREAHLEHVAGFGDHAGQAVAEVGCGVGTDGSRFLEDGARYLGVDQSGVAARTARATFDMLGLGGVVVQGDATAPPLRSEGVDFVYSNGVLHHIPDTEAAVRESRRVLRPAGQCLVMLYHRSSFNDRFTISGAAPHRCASAHGSRRAAPGGAAHR
jgi:SAM-dependent methyltransferase